MGDFTIDESEIKDFMKTEDMDRNTAVRCYFEDAGIIETGKKPLSQKLNRQHRRDIISNKEVGTTQQSKWYGRA